MTIRMVKNQIRPSTDVEFWYAKDHGFDNFEANSLKEFIEETTEISPDGLTLTRVVLLTDDSTDEILSGERLRMFAAREEYFTKNNIIYTHSEEKI